MSSMTGYPSIDLPQSVHASFREKNPIIPPLDVVSLLKTLSKKRFNLPAIDCDELHATYKELLDDAHLLYLAFKVLGIKKGEIVCISLPSNYQAIISFLALNELGAVTTFLDCYACEEEVISYIAKYKSPVFINYEKNLDENREFIKNTGIKYTITVKKQNENSRDLNGKLEKEYKEGIVDFHTLGGLASKIKDIFHLPNNKKAEALILYTSGSTGEPKSVVLTNENIIAAQMYAGNTSHTENITGTKTMTCVPLRYPYGMVTSLLTSLLWGKEAIMTPNWDSDTVNYYFNKMPNIVFGSPAVLDVTINFLQDNISLKQVSHFISGGDFLTVAHAENGYYFFRKHDNYNVEIGNGCGNAETVSIGSTPVGVPLKQHTAGKILVGSTPLIIDADTSDDLIITDGNALKEKSYEEVGELCLSGKYVFKEYFGEPEKTRLSKFVRNGKTFFRTGTLGYIDRDGYFIPTDRKSRFFIRSTGHKVYMDNVEHIIETYPDIDECAVVKVYDKNELYVCKAYIVLTKGINGSQNEAQKILKDLKAPSTYNGKTVKLKEYEVPRYIEFVDKLPLLPGTEKIDYQLLEKRN